MTDDQMIELRTAVAECKAVGWSSIPIKGDTIIALLSDLEAAEADLARVTSPEYLAEAIAKVGMVDVEWKARAEAAEAKLDAVTRERDEWRTVAGYEAGDPEEAALVKRVLEAARRTEAAEARASRLTEALAWIATYEPEHVAAAEEKFGLTQQENSDANPQ